MQTRWPVRSIASCIPVAVALAVCVGLTWPTAAAGQDDSSTPPAPAAGEPAASPAAEVPGLLGCGSTPYFGLAQTMPYVGERIAWRAAGVQPHSQVSVIATDLLNPQHSFRMSATGNGWCQASGTLVLPRPVQYQIVLVGTSSTTGESVELTAWPFAVLPPPSPPTPTPVPTPSAPSALRATQQNSNTVRLDWTDNASNATGLVIATRSGELPVPPRTTTMNVGGLSPNQAYCFTIVAVNSVGRSAGGGDCVTVKSMP